jgi:ABC-2 type transport system ATP-binding protein
MTEAVHTDQLTKRYGHTTALDSLDLVIEAGEVFGYLGPNGAGKSTTIALLLGLIRPTSGRAMIFGLDAWRDEREILRRLAYVPREANLWPSPPRRLIAGGGWCRRLARSASSSCVRSSSWPTTVCS